MNSRIEGGKLAFDVSPENEGKTEREQLIAEVKSWQEDEDEVNILKIADQYISYEVNGYDCYERKIYFPDTDSIDRIKGALVYDEAVKEYIDPDAVAEFIYNCIGVNALAAVQNIALLFDEPILNEDGKVEDWKETAGRQALCEKATDGCDDYAFEIGLSYETPVLGINWVEWSTVVISISAIVEAAKEMAETMASDYYGNPKEWHKEFSNEFEVALVSTICHEFRHTVYEMNEFTNKDGSDPRYPFHGDAETEVEDYGNAECERLRHDPTARTYIDKMITFDEGRIQDKVHAALPQDYER